MEIIDNNRKIKEYIKKNLAKGYTVDALRIALTNVQGYSRTAVERAIDQVNHELAESAPVLKEKPIIRHQIIDENDNPIMIEKPLWKRALGL